MWCDQETHRHSSAARQSRPRTEIATCQPGGSERATPCLSREDRSDFEEMQGLTSWGQTCRVSEETSSGFAFSQCGELGDAKKDRDGEYVEPLDCFLENGQGNRPDNCGLTEILV